MKAREVINEVLNQYKCFINLEDAKDIPSNLQRGVCDYLSNYPRDFVEEVILLIYDELTEAERNGKKRTEIHKYFLLPPVTTEGENNKRIIDKKALEKRIELLERVLKD